MENDVLQNIINLQNQQIQNEINKQIEKDEAYVDNTRWTSQDNNTKQNAPDDSKMVDSMSRLAQNFEGMARKLDSIDKPIAVDAGTMAGNYAANQTFRCEENAFYVVSKKVESQASWLYLAEMNHHLARDDRQYETLLRNVSADELRNQGVLVTTELKSFEKSYGDVCHSDQIENILQNGRFTTQIKVDDNVVEICKSYLSARVPSERDTQRLESALKSLGIENVKDSLYLDLRVAAREISASGTLSKSTIATPEMKAAAKRVVSEQKSNEGLLNAKTLKGRSGSLELMRKRSAANLASEIKGFTGSAKDKKALHLSLGKDGNPCYKFHDVVIPAETAERLKNHFDNFGTGKTDTEKELDSKGRAQLGRLETAFMDDTTKQGHIFQKSLYKITKSAGSLAYRTAAKNIGVVEDLARVAVNAGGQVASGALWAAGKITGGKGTEIGGDPEGVNEVSQWLTEKSQSLKDGTKNLVAGMKEDGKINLKNREEILQRQKELRHAKAGRNRTEVNEARRKLKETKQKVKIDNRTRRNDKYRITHNGKDNLGTRLRNMRDNKLKDLKDKGKDLWKSFCSTKYGGRIARFGGRVGAFGKRTGGRLIKTGNIAFRVADAIRRFNPISLGMNLISKIKGALIKYVGGALLAVLMMGLMVAAVGGIITAISSYFIDDTNYYQLLVTDLDDLELKFVEMVKNNAKYRAEQKKLTNKYGSSVNIEAARIGDIHLLDQNAKVINSMGSFVPYFAVAHYRYNTEITKDIYDVYREYMSFLWLNMHYVGTVEVSNITYHDSISSCEDKIYYHNTNIWGNPAWTKKISELKNPDGTTCPDYERERLDKKCKKAEHSHDYDTNGACYEWEEICIFKYYEIESHNCEENPDSCYMSAKPGTKKKICDLDAHSHSDSCYNWKYRCNGHCAGHVTPTGHISVLSEDFKFIVSGDTGRDSYIFRPLRSLNIQVNFIKNANTDNNTAWNQYWARELESVNNGTAYGPETNQTYPFFSVSTWVPKNLSSYNQGNWTQQDLETMASLYGTYETHFREGVTTWEDYDVYLSSVGGELTLSETEQWMQKIENAYGLDSKTFWDIHPAGQLIVSALENVGKFVYDYDSDTASTDFFNEVVRDAWCSTAPNISFKTWNKKAQKCYENFFLTFDELEPGTVLLDKEQQQMAVFLGYIDGRYYIIDAYIGAGTSAIHAIGYDQLSRNYTRVILPSKFADIKSDLIEQYQ